MEAVRRRPNIIEAIENKRVFGFLPRFRSLDTWASWMVVLKAIFGLPLDDAELLVFSKLTNRVSPPTDPREIYIIAGRRSGKSFMTALIATFMACFSDFRQYVTVGETLVILCLARDREQAKIVFRYVQAILHAVPVLKAMIVAERQDEIELMTGTTVMVKSNDFRGVRGLTICLCICDEICFWDSIGANPDKEVIAAVRPAMVTVRTSKLICISSPYATVGLMFEQHRQHYGKESDDLLVIQAPTELLNPTIDENVVQREIEKDPEAGRSEWLAEFRADITAAFSQEMIESCVIPGRLQLPAMPDYGYVAFTDPSGGRHDQFVTAIAHLYGDKVILDALCTTRPPFSPADTAKEHAEFLKSYGVTGTTGDAYAGEWPREQFARNGVNYQVSEKNKSKLYLGLIPVMTSRRLELLDNRKMIDELRRLERRRGRSGKDVIDHGLRGSDDVINATAGAVHMALEQCADSMPEASGHRTFSKDSWDDEMHHDHPMDVLLDRTRRNRTFWN